MTTISYNFDSGGLDGKALVRNLAISLSRGVHDLLLSLILRSTLANGLNTTAAANAKIIYILSIGAFGSVID